MTHYQLLGILLSAKTDQIRIAYRKKAFLLHPDRNKSPNAHQQFIAIRQAYEILSNPIKRAKYDVQLCVNKFPDIPHQQSSVSSTYVPTEEEKIRNLYEEIEYLKHIHYDPIEEWVKLYRMSWKEWGSIPFVVKMKKIGAELIFRSCYAILGIFVCLFISVFFIQSSHSFSHRFFHITMAQGLIIFGSAFFILAKEIGQIYRQFKKED
jgi:hypothetical protein